MKSLKKINKPTKYFTIPIGGGSATFISKPTKETIEALKEMIRLAKNMKLLIILTLLSFTTHAQELYHNCPLSGDNPRTASKDSLKNRFEIPNYYTPLSFDDMAIMTYDDTSTYPAVIEGYVILIKSGGKETCNCHSATDLDVHIELTKDSSFTEAKDAIIVEITPRIQALMKAQGIDYSMPHLKQTILHKRVRVYGYLFSDSEHKQNSSADNGRGRIWRISCKELHPVCKIEIE